nr:hypothetical protein [Marinicella sp. W31]MDC2877951.1 hypothetical protein [Marinicella sp. W31]
MLGTDVLMPDRPLRELRAIDPKVVIPPGAEENRLADFMKEKLGGKPQIADRLHLGPLSLIVREADEAHNVTSIGVWREPEEQNTPRLFRRWRDRTTKRWSKFKR